VTVLLARERKRGRTCPPMSALVADGVATGRARSGSPTWTRSVSLIRFRQRTQDAVVQQMVSRTTSKQTSPPVVK
jgi:hypothetical protein